MVSAGEAVWVDCAAAVRENSSVLATGASTGAPGHKDSDAAEFDVDPEVGRSFRG
jgi:hypothetical protein